MKKGPKFIFFPRERLTKILEKVEVKAEKKKEDKKATKKDLESKKN